MEVCQLCLEREANKTGSHIFTWSLIGPAVNQAGRLDRDYEIAFAISTSTFTDKFIGRSVLPDDIDKVLGKTLSDEEIRCNDNFFTVDNIFCRTCEERFKIAEDFFLDELLSPLRNDQITFDTLESGTQVANFSSNSIAIDILRLNIYIQVWRASVVGFNGFKLKSNEEERLRKLIDLNLGSNLQETIEICAANSLLLRELPMIVIFLETDDFSENNNSSSTRNYVGITRNVRPYFFMLNDIYVQLFFKSSHVRSSIQHLFGLSNMLNRFECVNTNESDFKVVVLSAEDTINLLEKITSWLIRKVFYQFQSRFSYSFRYLFKEKPSAELMKKTIDTIVFSDDIPAAERYTSERIQNIFKGSIMSYLRNITE